MHTAFADVPAAVRHRAATATVRLVSPDGAPLSGRPVTVEQVRHTVGFGNIGFDFIELTNDEHESGPRVSAAPEPNRPSISQGSGSISTTP